MRAPILAALAAATLLIACTDSENGASSSETGTAEPTTAPVGVPDAGFPPGAADGTSDDTSDDDTLGGDTTDSETGDADTAPDGTPPVEDSADTTLDTTEPAPDGDASPTPDGEGDSAVSDATHPDIVEPGSDDGVSCEEATCQDLLAECGTVADGCGGTLDCGACQAPMTCSADLLCECEPECNGLVCGAADGCAGTCQAGSGCCQNTCGAQGASECVDGSSVQTCGQFNADACLEWSPANECASGECTGDACVPPATLSCGAPVEIIAGPGATGSGACDTDNMLLDDGEAAEFWANSNNSWDQGGLPVSKCMVVDFGEVCTPNEICVEAWAGEGGCSGDTCGGPCELCKGQSATALDVFAYEKNSTSNYQYQFSMYVDASGDPGNTQCYKSGADPIRYVLVCRANCGASSGNAFVDYVWLQ